MSPGASLILLQSDGGLKNKTRQGPWRAAYCEYCNQQSDATALRRTAAVVRHRRHILDLGDLDTQVVQRANRGFATRARALDANFEVLHTTLDGNLACRFGR